MLSTPTSAHFTLDICIASLSHCTRCWQTQQIRIEALSFGARQIQEVRRWKICRDAHALTDVKGRANAACILACYMVLIQNWPPHLALAPIAQMDPPCMPFRDAGYSQADYVLTIQDVVYGVWRAKEAGLFSLKEFSLEE